MDSPTTWKVVDAFFQSDPRVLVKHHIASYDEFAATGITQIFKDYNPMIVTPGAGTGADEHMCKLYFGGKDGSRVRFGKPTYVDESGEARYLFPNEARLRNMSYVVAVYYDIEVEFFEGAVAGGDGAPPAPVGPPFVIENVYFCKLPIMLHSRLCILTGLPREALHAAGECRNDIGGYFIIDGMEKSILPQEKFADNMMAVRKFADAPDIPYTYSVSVRSVSENVAKPVRKVSVSIVAPTTKLTNLNIVVTIPNVRKPVPLFIVFRALGFLSDREIIAMCLLDMDKYAHLIDLFRPSVHDAAAIMTQNAAILYIASLTKFRTPMHALKILADYFLPHIGETCYIRKAYYLGYMVFRMLRVSAGDEPPTDRDNVKYKRMELAGQLLADLVREYYIIQKKAVNVGFSRILLYNKGVYDENLRGLVQEHHTAILRDCKDVDVGVRRAFKGNWGAATHTKRVGVVQDLNRLSKSSVLAQLRKTNLNLSASAKVVEPHQLHCTQWGYFDPMDSPDGPDVGLIKNLAIMTHISLNVPRAEVERWLLRTLNIVGLEERAPAQLAHMTRVFVNGLWLGALDTADGTTPLDAVAKIRVYRRAGLVPVFLSVAFDAPANVIYVYSDGGRLCRPVLCAASMTDGPRELQIQSKAVAARVRAAESGGGDGSLNWTDLVCGFHPRKPEAEFDMFAQRFYDAATLYAGAPADPAESDAFAATGAPLEYIDCNESEGSLIALDVATYLANVGTKYTHCEIHGSVSLGIMCNQFPFADHNQATRATFSSSQVKQAASMFHTNFQSRMDKMSIVLNYGQQPLVKTRYSEYIDRGEHPYGENLVVAIMCYTGYNMEDSILLNAASVARGMFRTSYFTTYKGEEKVEKTDLATNIETTVANPLTDPHVGRTKEGRDYSLLSPAGIIREGERVDETKVLIGMLSRSSADRTVATDVSVVAKKGQRGVVDKVYMADGASGGRVAKVRVLEQRAPTEGDKLASRMAQKGVVGILVPECDMPFTKNGVRPDIIINPHAVPTRRTVSQLMECVLGKACAIYGAHGDGTSFNAGDNKVELFGDMLRKHGFHSTGNELMYDGFGGAQIESDVFVGPTYYMRLKHMVKDKINYRARGPRSMLTKQTTGGRANDGGLRIGEMERDVLISHGITSFMTDSMMNRGDQYEMAICNKTGMIAVYNPAKNVFMSPMADGPIQFTGPLDDGSFRVRNVTRFGRSFSVVRVPYVFKLLIQELQTANIQMRIITEANVDYLESLEFSHRIAAKALDQTTDGREDNDWPNIRPPPPPTPGPYGAPDEEDNQYNLDDDVEEFVPESRGAEQEEGPEDEDEEDEPLRERLVIEGDANETPELDYEDMAPGGEAEQTPAEPAAAPTEPGAATFSFSPTINIGAPAAAAQPSAKGRAPSPARAAAAAEGDAAAIFEKGEDVVVKKMD
jgi:DNA-directed RNA polymerase II subunit RPB2